MMMNLILPIILLSAFFSVSCISDRTPEEIEEAISKSEVLTRVNKLCIELPKPDNFRLIEKQFRGNTDTAAIQFFYASDKYTEEIQKFYEQWATANGWKLIEEDHSGGRYYERGNQKIVVEFVRFGDANVEVTCQEKR